MDLTAGDAESAKKGKGGGGERGFQGTALGWHARQLVQSGHAAVTGASAQGEDTAPSLPISLLSPTKPQMMHTVTEGDEARDSKPLSPSDNAEAGESMEREH